MQVNDETTPFDTPHRRWAWGRDLRVLEPSQAELADFSVWLQRVRGIDVETIYPGMALPLVFELYRQEYAAAAGRVLFPLTGNPSVTIELPAAL